MPETRTISVDAGRPDPGALDVATDLLRRGRLVAFPTETVYGLGADAFNAEAVRGVFRAKGRPADNPLIVHLAHTDQIAQVASEIPRIALALAQRFWPGPMTLVLRGNGTLPAEVTAGLDSVAVRIPDHPVPRALVDALGGGIVGPSANRSGRPSPTTAAHVFADLNGSIDLILDSGATRIGVESTVIDVTMQPPVILRPGGLSREEIQNVVGDLAASSEVNVLRRSPGTQHRHYAPKARVVVVPSGDERRFRALLDEHLSAGRTVGALVRSFTPSSTDRVVVRSVGMTSSDVAHRLFAAMRELEEAGVDVMLVEEVDEAGIGFAVADRIRRAAQRE